MVNVQHMIVTVIVGRYDKLNRINFESAYNNNRSKHIGAFNESARVDSEAAGLYCIDCLNGAITPCVGLQEFL